ncbi:MAG TPA: hypothetical protein PLS34_07365, partial [Gammaproteobacteria bacterium]|nr:hypothetical protein [Gammaproteobacteria bacterium]
EEMRYGSEEECKALIGKIRNAVAVLGPSRPSLADIETRAQSITRQAQFRSARETVPMAASVSRIDLPVRSSEGPSVRRIPLEVNVLAEEYWDIYDVFIP